MSTAAILTEAGTFIADPKRWTQGAMARNGAGDAVPPDDRRAVKFDAIGIIVAHCRVDLDDEKDWRQWREFIPCMFELDRAASRLYRRTLEGVNDDIGHESVLCVYRAAIRAARSEAAFEGAST